MTQINSGLGVELLICILCPVLSSANFVDEILMLLHATQLQSLRHVAGNFVLNVHIYLACCFVDLFVWVFCYFC